MTSKEIIKCITDLEYGVKPLEDISSILLQHKCNYLLSKLPESLHYKQYKLNHIYNTIAVNERLRNCIPIFNQSSVPYAVIKGAVLSQTIYNDPYIRTSGDVDVLIRREDSDYIKQLLLSNGFIQGKVTPQGVIPFSRQEILFQTAMSHQTAPYIKITDNPICPYINLDLNIDILWGESNNKTDMDLVLSNVQDVDIGGVLFKKLMPEMEFISLCLHNYKDMNSIFLLSQGSLHIGLYCDIFEYIYNVKPNPNTIYQLARRLNVGPYVYVCISQTAELFGASIFKRYLKSLECFRDDYLCNSFGLNKLEQKKWEMSLAERLFNPDLANYINSKLSNVEKEKIKINRLMM